MAQTVITHSEEETRSFARSFASSLRRGDVVALYGELGAGKTQFIKGVCQHFGVREPVASPTFVLLNRYSGVDREGRELLVYHFDLYRIRSLDEVYDLGFEEILHGNGITLIEWAEVMEELLPVPRYDVRLELGLVESERRITVEQVREQTAAVNRGTGERSKT